MAHTIEVRGMSCEGCENTVKDALESLNGVTAVQIDLDTGTVRVDGEPNWRDLEKAVTDAGYEVTRN